jgi:hypothetical protein
MRFTVFGMVDVAEQPEVEGSRNCWKLDTRLYGLVSLEGGQSWRLGECKYIRRVLLSIRHVPLVITDVLQM